MFTRVILIPAFLHFIYGETACLPGRNFQYKATVVSDVPTKIIDELIRYTDSIAEVYNTLRQGLSVTLTT